MEERIHKLLYFLHESPDDTFLLFALAKEYDILHKDEEAERYYKRLMEIDEQYVGLYFHFGKFYEKLERPEEALDIYKKGIAMAQKLSEHHALSELMSAKTNLEMEMI